MKITKRDLSVIMILAGLLIVFLSYRMMFTPKQAEIEALQAEQKTLKAQIDELQPVKEKAPFYQSEMKRFASEADQWVKEFPADVKYEDDIMYVDTMENDIDVKVPNMNFSEAALIKNVEGAGSLAGKNYTLSSANISMNYEVKDYDALKSLLNYVYESETGRNTITNVSISFDKKDEGKIAGSLGMNLFVFTDGLQEYEEVELPSDDKGVECIFGETEEAEEN